MSCRSGLFSPPQPQHPPRATKPRWVERRESGAKFVRSAPGEHLGRHVDKARSQRKRCCSSDRGTRCIGVARRTRSGVRRARLELLTSDKYRRRSSAQRTAFPRLDLPELGEPFSKDLVDPWPHLADRDLSSTALLTFPWVTSRILPGSGGYSPPSFEASPHAYDGVGLTRHCGIRVHPAHSAASSGMRDCLPPEEGHCMGGHVDRSLPSRPRSPGTSAISPPATRVRLPLPEGLGCGTALPSPWSRRGAARRVLRLLPWRHEAIGDNLVETGRGRARRLGPAGDEPLDRAAPNAAVRHRGSCWGIWRWWVTSVSAGRAPTASASRRSCRACWKCFSRTSGHSLRRGRRSN